MLNTDAAPCAFVSGQRFLQGCLSALSETSNSTSDVTRGRLLKSRQDGIQTGKLLVAALGLGGSVGIIGAMSRKNSLCGRFCRRRRSARRALELPLKRVTIQDCGVAQRVSSLSVTSACQDSADDVAEFAKAGVHTLITPVSRSSNVPELPVTPFSIRHRLGSSSCPQLPLLEPEAESMSRKKHGRLGASRSSSCSSTPRIVREHSASKRQFAASEQEDLQSSPSSATSHLSPERRGRLWQVPEDHILESIFDQVDITGSGTLDRAGLGQALELVEQRCAFPAACLGLGRQLSSTTSKDDSVSRADRLFTLLATGDQQTTLVVSKHAFIAGLQDLVEVANCLQGLSARQFLEVLLLAFERFDENSDGLLSSSEFSAALNSLGLEFAPRAQQKLHALLDVDGDGFIEHATANASELERWVNAFRTSVEFQVQHRAQKIMPLVESLHAAATANITKSRTMNDLGTCEPEGSCQRSHDAQRQSQQTEELPKYTAKPRIIEEAWHGPQEFLKSTMSALVERAEAVADAVECSLDLAGTILALQGVARELEGAATWDDVNLGDLSPFLAFLGVTALHMMREFNQSQPAKDLTADEAMLYVQSFQEFGFSITEFRQLLTAGFSWLDIPQGDALDASSYLLVILRGSVTSSVKAQAKTAVKFGPGSVFANELPAGRAGPQRQDSLMAAEMLRCASWNQAALQEFLDANPRTKERMFSFMTKSRCAQHARNAFRVADSTCSGSLEADGLKAALRLYLQYHGHELQLQQSEKVVQRFAETMLSRDSNMINKDKFVSTLQELALGLVAVNGLTVQQAHAAAIHALEHFGQKGNPSSRHFAAAFDQLQLNMPKRSAEAMHIALEHGFNEKLVAAAQTSARVEVTQGSTREAGFEIPDACRVADAFKAAMQRQWRRKGFDDLGSAIHGVMTGTAGSDAPRVAAGDESVCDDSYQRKQDAPHDGMCSVHDLFKEPELLQESVEKTMDVTAFLTASFSLSLELCGQQSWSEFNASEVVPLLLFVGVSGAYMARDLAGHRHLQGSLQAGSPSTSEGPASDVVPGYFS